jgi:hypothetical protein
MQLRFLITLLVTCGSLSFSQGYYPLQVGNQWDYGEIDFHTPGQYHYLYSVHILGDTIMPNGLTYAIQSGNFGPQFLRQSGPRVYAFLENKDSVLYDFTLEDGDTAFFFKDSTYYTLVTVNIGQTQVFGKSLKAWYYTRTTNTSSDGGARYTIADSIGRTYIFIDGGYTDYLMGAVINGTRYGTVTRVTPKGDIRPYDFRLLQNYPNPFNPNTTIKFELPKTSQVNLRVIDILGREVTVLVNERRDAGVHEVKFDGSNLASGVYFYRLQEGDYVASKKMLVVK